MSDFRAKIIAELDTSKIDQQIKNVGKNVKIQLNDFTLNTNGLANKIQQALDGHQFTLNLTNVKIDNLSNQITGQMQSAGTRAGQEFSQSLLNRIKTQISTGGIDASISKVTSEFNRLTSTLGNLGNGSGVERIKTQLQSVESEFETLEGLKKDFASGKLNDSGLVTTYEKFNQSLKSVKNTMSMVKDESKQWASTMEAATLRSKMSNWLENNPRAAKVHGQEIKSYISQLDSMSSQGEVASNELNRLADSFKRVDMAADGAGLKGKGFASSLSGAIKSISRYVSASALIYKSFYAIKEGIKEVVAIDTALVDLKKTTDGTTGQLREFYYSSNDIAKQLGVSTKEVVQAAADWSRLGYSIKDAETMAKTSSIFASISPGMDIQTATDGLVSTMKAFGIEAEDTLDGVASKINAIGNTQAVTNEDIVNILTRSSAAMKEANNTLEETIALGTAATEIVRNADMVGTALKTVSLRIRGYDEETEEYIGGIEELTGDIADLTKSAEHPLGISLFKDDAKTEFKSTTELFRDISKIYDELTDKQQAGLLEKLAGKRQAQVVAAILNNFDAVEKSLETMTSSAGSSLKEMSVIQDSLEFKLNALKETAVGVFQNAFDTNALGGVIDVITSIIKAIDWLIDKFGVLGVILPSIGIAKFIKDFD